MNKTFHKYGFLLSKDWEFISDMDFGIAMNERGLKKENARKRGEIRAPLVVLGVKLHIHHLLIFNTEGT